MSSLPKELTLLLRSYIFACVLAPAFGKSEEAKTASADVLAFTADALEENLKSFYVEYTYDVETGSGMSDLAKAVGSPSKAKAGTIERHLECTLAVKDESWQMRVVDSSVPNGDSTVQFDGTLYYSRDNKRNRGQISVSTAGGAPRIDEFSWKIPKRYDYLQGTLGALSFADLIRQSAKNGSLKISPHENNGNAIIEAIVDRQEAGLPALKLVMEINVASGFQPLALTGSMFLDQERTREMKIVECQFLEYKKVSEGLSLPMRIVLSEITTPPSHPEVKATSLEVRKHTFKINKFSLDPVLKENPFKAGDLVYDQLTNETFTVGDILKTLSDQIRPDTHDK